MRRWAGRGGDILHFQRLGLVCEQVREHRDDRQSNACKKENHTVYGAGLSERLNTTGMDAEVNFLPDTSSDNEPTNNIKVPVSLYLHAGLFDFLV